MDIGSQKGFLESLDWAKPATLLLSNSHNLIQNTPAQMVIRHSERINIEKQSEISAACLTEKGREAARAFGRGLPKNRILRIFHSTVDRCADTATLISEGARSAGIETNGVAELRVLNFGPDINSKFWSNVIRDWPHSFNYWLCGRYSPTEVETSFDYSKRLASELERVSSEVDLNTLDLYVTHDVVLMATLFHWFGELPGSGHIGFLNGFLMQRSNDMISLFVGDSHRMLDYPYWWIPQ